MLTWVRGKSIFDSKMDVLVNPVNTVGCSGAGLALAFARRYPKMQEAYKHACAVGDVHIGRSYLWRPTDAPYNTPFGILCFPTKKHWLNPSRLDYVEMGLDDFIKRYEDLDIKSIAFPALGCGNGGLPWFDVRRVMEKKLHTLPIPVEIYEPQ